jgi:hypothetical protein
LFICNICTNGEKSKIQSTLEQLSIPSYRRQIVSYWDFSISVATKISLKHRRRDLWQALENDNNDNKVNDAHAKYYSSAEHLAVVKIIQRWRCLQIIHTKGKISSLGYRSTNCVTQMGICMAWTNNYKCNSDRSRLNTICILIIYSPDLCDNLHTIKIHSCGPVRHIMKQECHRIFTERNSNWNGVTFRLVRGDLIEVYEWEQQSKVLYYLSEKSNKLSHVL